MYKLQDQVRNMAVDCVAPAPPRRTRALCEFDGEKWVPIEIVDEAQLDKLQPALRRLSHYQPGNGSGGGGMMLPHHSATAGLQDRDSAYASTAGSTGHRSPSASVDMKYENSNDSYNGRTHTPSIHSIQQQQQQSQAQQYQQPQQQQHGARSRDSSLHADPYNDAQQTVADSFRRSSSFRLPTLDLDIYDEVGSQKSMRSGHSQEYGDLADVDESLDEEERDVVQEMLVEQHALQQQSGGQSSNELRRPSILASPAYQRNLINFQDLAISEVDVSEESADCDLPLCRQHIISAFPKQFELELKSPKPLTSFSVYSRAEDYVEMLHVVLVLESRKAYWKNMGSTTKPLDKVTSLPYPWAADLDLPPLSLEEPRVTNDVECMIGGRTCQSVILCDNHNDECRKCKGLASEDDCFACDGTGIFKKKPCVMCTGNGKYFCKACENKAKAPCRNCGSMNGPAPILRQAYVQCTRETVVSQTMEVSSDNKALLIMDARKLARQTIEAEKFEEGTLPVAACGVVIRNRGHIICATDIKTGSRGLFEVVDGIDRVTFKGQLAPVVSQSNGRSSGSVRSGRSAHSQSSTRSRGSWFRRNKEPESVLPDDRSDAASVKSTASKARSFFKFGKNKS